MKDIKDYLHFYLGCECKWEGSMIYKLSGITTDCKGNDKYFLIDSHGFTCVDVDFKPILRRLDSLTEEEKKEEIEITNVLPTDVDDYHDRQRAARGIKYLLSKGFWLFGDEAFDKGLIIDSKTLNKQLKV